MNTTTTAFEPAAALLAGLLSWLPGALVPGLVALAAGLCLLVLVDGFVDRAAAGAA